MSTPVKEKTPIRIPIALRPAIVKLLAADVSPEKIAFELNDPEKKIELEVSEILRFKNSQKQKLANARKEVAQETAVTVTELLSLADRANRKALERSLRDIDRQEEYDRMFENDEITADEHSHYTAKLRPLDVNDVIKISESLEKRLEKAKGVTPPNAGLQMPNGFDPLLMASLSEAIKNGDPIKVQQILWGGKDALPAPASSRTEENKNTPA